MKLLVIILSIYTIALSAIPCDDVFIDIQESISISQSVEDVNHNPFDLCSPFCSCVCCASFFTEPSSYSEIILTKIFTKKIDGFSKTPFLSNYFPEIYQPPRV